MAHGLNLRLKLVPGLVETQMVCNHFIRPFVLRGKDAFQNNYAIILSEGD